MGLSRILRRLRKKNEETAGKKKRRKVLFESLEQRLLLSSDVISGMTAGTFVALGDISSGSQSAITSGLGQVDTALSSGQGFSDKLNLAIPGVLDFTNYPSTAASAKTLAGLLLSGSSGDLGTFLDSNLKTPLEGIVDTNDFSTTTALKDYLTNTLAPVLDFFKDITLNGVSTSLNAINGTTPGQPGDYEYDVDLTFSASAEDDSNLHFDLGRDADVLGLKVPTNADGSEQFGLMPQVGLQGDMTFNLTFGLDVTIADTSTKVGPNSGDWTNTANPPAPNADVWQTSYGSNPGTLYFDDSLSFFGPVADLDHVTAANDWFWDSGSNTLYVYATINPAGTVKLNQQITVTTPDNAGGFFVDNQNTDFLAKAQVVDPYSHNPGVTFNISKLQEGFLDISVSNGTFSETAQSDVTFNDLNNDGKTFTTELSAGFAASDAGSSMDVKLPISVNKLANNVTFFDPGLPEVDISTNDPLNPEFGPLTGSNDPRSAPPLTINSDFESNLLPFKNINAGSLLGMLDQFDGWLKGLSQSSVFSNVDIPFATDTTLANELDFSTTFETSLLDVVAPKDASGNRQPDYHSAQDFINKIDDISPIPLNQEYDTGTHQLTFDLKLHESLPVDASQPTTTVGAPIDLSLDLSPLSDLKGNIQVQLTSGAGLEATFGIDLGATSPIGMVQNLQDETTILGLFTDSTGANPVPINGVLIQDITFTLAFGSLGSVPVTLKASDTSGNSSIDDLKSELETAIDGAVQALPGVVVNVVVTPTGRLELTTPTTAYFTFTDQSAVQVVGSWTQVGSSNVWSASLASSPVQIFFDFAPGTRETKQADLGAANQWFWDSGADTLYIWSATDPNTNNVKVKATQIDELGFAGIQQGTRVPTPLNGVLGADPTFSIQEGTGAAQSVTVTLNLKPGYSISDLINDINGDKTVTGADMDTGLKAAGLYPNIQAMATSGGTGILLASSTDKFFEVTAVNGVTINDLGYQTGQIAAVLSVAGNRDLTINSSDWAWAADGALTQNVTFQVTTTKGSASDTYDVTLYAADATTLGFNPNQTALGTLIAAVPVVGGTYHYNSTGKNLALSASPSFDIAFVLTVPTDVSNVVTLVDYLVQLDHADTSTLSGISELVSYLNDTALKNAMRLSDGTPVDLSSWVVAGSTAQNYLTLSPQASVPGGTSARLTIKSLGNTQDNRDDAGGDGLSDVANDLNQALTQAQHTAGSGTANLGQLVFANAIVVDTDKDGKIEAADDNFQLTLGAVDAAVLDQLQIAGTSNLGSLNFSNTTQTVTGPPSNGQLSNDATFSLRLDQGSGAQNYNINITKASTTSNTSILDLVADVNAALGTAGLGGLVVAGLAGHRITLSSTDVGATGGLLQVFNSNGIAVNELGFPQSGLTSSAITNPQFFVKDPKLFGEVSLTIPDNSTVQGNYGYVGIDANLTGTITAGISLDVGAALGKSGQEIPLSDLFGAVADQAQKAELASAVQYGPVGTEILGFGDGQSGTTSLVADDFPSFGKINLTFTLNVDGTDHTVTLNPTNAVTKLSDLVSDLNSGGVLPSGVTATSNSGKLELDGPSGKSLKVTHPPLGGTLTLSNTGTGFLQAGAFDDLANSLGANPSIAIELDAITNLVNGTNVHVTPNADVGHIPDFNTIGFDSIVTGITSLLDVLNNLSSNFDFLDEPLPVLGVTANSIVGYIDKFQGFLNTLEAGSNAGQSIQQVESLLLQAFGLPANSSDLQFALDNFNSDQVLKITTKFSDEFKGTLPVNVDLSDLGLDLPTALTDNGLVNLAGNANLAADFSIDAELDLGIDLANPAQLFIYDSSGLDFKGLATAKNVTFTASLGPLGLFVKGGAAAFNSDGDPNNTTTPAELKFSLPAASGGKYAISATDISSVTTALSSISATFNAGAGLDLPVYFPTSSSYIGDLAFQAAMSLVNGTGLDVNFSNSSLPDFSNIDFTNFSILDSLPLFVQGFDQVLSGIEKGLSDAFANPSFKLPIIGDAAAGGAQFIETFRSDVIGPLLEAVESDPAPNLVQMVQEVIFDALGPSGLDLLALNPNWDGDSNLDFHDVQYSLDNDHFQFNLQLEGDYPFTIPGFDLGIPAIGLQFNGGTTVELGWDLLLGMGVSRTDGFYMVTDPQTNTFTASESSPNTFVTPVSHLTGQPMVDPVQLGVNVFLPESISGNLVFLTLTGDNENNVEFLGFNNKQTVQGGPLTAANDLAAFDPNAMLDPNNPVHVYNPDFNLNFLLTVTDDTGTNSYTVSLKKGDISGNTSIGDLVTELNNALKNTTDKDGNPADISSMVMAGSSGNKLVFTPQGSTSALTISGLPALAGDFKLGLTGGNSNGRLPFAQIANLGFDTTNPSQLFGAYADLDLGLNLGLNSALFSTPGVFPSLVAEFQLDWGVGADGGAKGSAHPTDPLLHFNDIGLNLGSFISDTLAPVLHEIQTFTEPVQPLVDIITSPIPVISDLAGQPISLVDIAQLFSNDLDLGYVTAVAKIISTINSIPTDAGNVIIPFGSFTLGDAPLDLTDPHALDAVKQEGSDLANLVPEVGDAISAFQNAGGFANALSKSGASESTAAFTTDLSTGGGVGFEFPILNDPSTIFGMLLGRPADLVTFTLPQLKFDFQYSQFFPIIGPLGGEITGGLGIAIHAKVGYDTAGIQEFAQGGFNYPLEVFDGFFIDERIDPNTGLHATGVDLTGKLTASAVANLGVAEVGAGGGVFATIEFSLFDPDGDGKLRVPEIVGDLQNGGPLGLFEVSGDISAHMFAFIKILFVLNFNVQLGPDLPLLSFDITPTAEPVLARDMGDGVLRLNMGPNAADRLNTNTTDGNEYFKVSLVDPDTNTVAVSASFDEGNTWTDPQNYSGITKIEGDGGQGNDYIDLSGVGTGAAKPISAEIKGGFGNDVLIAGDGTDAVLMGGAGDDVLIGAGADDQMFGEDGNDKIVGGGGSDYIDGGKGDDMIAGNDGNDTIIGGDGNDVIYGGAGNDTLIGGQGNDEIHGDADATLGSSPSYTFTPAAASSAGNDIIDGGDGKDTLFGDGGDDLIAGGAASDTIDGGDGNDRIWGDSTFQFDTSQPYQANLVMVTDPHTLSQIPALNAPLYGAAGADIIKGGLGNDLIFGEGDNDIILGDNGTVNTSVNYPQVTLGSGGGDDVIYGGTGSDIIYGGAGNDVLMGQEDSDAVYGNGGNDLVLGDEYYDADIANPSNIRNDLTTDLNAFDSGDPTSDLFHTGGAGNDILFGDDGEIVTYDTLTLNPQTIQTTEPSVSGSDWVRGGAGDDIAFGGPGADDKAHDGGVQGGSGNDILFGDMGHVEYDLVSNHSIISKIATPDPGTTEAATGDVDTVFGEDGNDTMFGGPAGDTMYGFTTASPQLTSDQDVMIGDGGKVDFDTTGKINNVIPVSRIEDIQTYATADDAQNDKGGNDSMYGGPQNDIMMGGFEMDTMSGGTGDDTMIGDQGKITFDLPSGHVAEIQTTDTVQTDGDVDTMAGNNGNDIMLGGVAGDIMNGNDGNDIIVGDEGLLRYDVAASTSIPNPSATTFTNWSGHLYGDGDITTLDLVQSTSGFDSVDPTLPLGGSDTLSGDAGKDVLIGGMEGDTIYGDNETASNGASDLNDIMLGDNGAVFMDAEGTAGALDVFGSTVALITTTDTAENTGGADTMSGNAGDDIILGGVNNGDVDKLYGDREVPEAASIAADGNDVLLGDNGVLDFNSAGTDPADAHQHPLALIESFMDGSGGVDWVFGGAGNDVAMGGTAGDQMYGDADATIDNGAHLAGSLDGRDILLGDNGVIILSGTLTAGEMHVLGSPVITIETTDQTQDYGGSDTISGNAQGDFIAGGVFGDMLYGDRAIPDDASSAIDGNDYILGDNARLEWGYQGDSAFASIESQLNKPFNGGTSSFDSGANDLMTLDLVTTELTTGQAGGRDLIHGDAGNDFLAGGEDADEIHGDSGTDTGQTGNFNDVIFGDHGRIYPQNNTLANTPLSNMQSHNFFSIDTGDNATTLAHAAGDQIFGEQGDDIAIGGQGDDRIFGGSGNDDLIGGHNVTGGIDELSTEVIQAVGSDINDIIDGGSGDDAIAGDNATIWRKVDLSDPRFQNLNGTLMYQAYPSTALSETDPNYGSPDVTGVPQQNPGSSLIFGRDVTLLDHNAAIQNQTGARPFGNDYLAGGTGNDEMWGELGGDVMQGDGSIDTSAIGGNISSAIVVTDSGSPDTGQTLYFNVYERTNVDPTKSDGDDYMEGNGGADLMYGGLGQDDMIGGSSSLFGLNTPDQRPDTGDTIFGGAGDRIDRNYMVPGSYDYSNNQQVPGTDNFITPDQLHARDSDFILGDNGNIYRLVGTNNTYSGAFLTFNYDTNGGTAPGTGFLYGYGTLKIIPRAALSLDYVQGDISTNYGDTLTNGVAHGGDDIIHGEAGDDFIHGMVGNDVLYGDSQDDDISGGAGNDWISGGTGDDGVLGDDGLIFTSRNGTAEPLYGIPAVPAGQTLDQLITTPGNMQQSVINVHDELKKTFDLVPLPFGAPNTESAHTTDDIIYGGLGDDFLHGGTGDDAISGAEALPLSAANQNGHLVLFDYDHPYQSSYMSNNQSTQYDPTVGNILGYDLGPAAKKDVNRRFLFYDGINADAREKIMLGADGSRVMDLTTPLKFEYLLNFEAFTGDGVVASITADQQNAITGITYVKGTPLSVTDAEKLYEIQNIVNDGNDVIFGDSGNDWLVGGTSLDRLYGGSGDDLMNVDDNLETNGGLNDIPDGTYFNISGSTVPGADGSAFSGVNLDKRLAGTTIGADIAYGGAGLDVLTDNTGADRLIDWVGEFNSFITPYAPFGEASVSRTLQPQMQEYLYALSESDGADPSRAFDAGGDPARNGEPYGELALVLQHDSQWHDQTGGPRDQQAGNTPGGHRDVMAAADFTNPIDPTPFAPVSGAWTVADGVYQGATVDNGDAISIFDDQVQLASYYEVLATANLSKPTGGVKSNAFIVFDYYSPTDFKFAGIDGSTNKIEIGERTQYGWSICSSSNMRITSNKDYSLTLAVEGTKATLLVDGSNALSYTFAPRLLAGVSTDLNTGYLALGTNNAVSRFDNVVVQELSPVPVFQMTEDFSGSAGLLAGQTGAWLVAGGRYAGTPGTDAALSTLGLSVDPASMTQLQATVNTRTMAGFVFDYYDSKDFKFAAISPATGQVIIGHRTAAGWFNDVVVSKSLSAGVDYTLSISLTGATVNVSLNGNLVATNTYDRDLNFGDAGLFTKAGVGYFDNVKLTGDDPGAQSRGQDLASPQNLIAAGAPTVQNGAVSELTYSQLDAIIQEAEDRWAESLGAGVIGQAALDQVTFQIVNFGDLTLGRTMGSAVLIDPDAAGWGWFVDATPSDDVEFGLKLSDVEEMATQSSPAFSHMDLLTVVMHELGHVLGFGDLDPSAGSLMSGALDAGVRINPENTPIAHHSSNSLVSMNPSTESKGLLDVSIGAFVRGKSSWLGDFLVDGMKRDRDNPFDPKLKVRIALFDDEEDR
jgi:Ca2+-binding RTX toxin-like protein